MSKAESAPLNTAPLATSMGFDGFEDKRWLSLRECFGELCAGLDGCGGDKGMPRYSGLDISVFGVEGWLLVCLVGPSGDSLGRIDDKSTVSRNDIAASKFVRQ